MLVGLWPECSTAQRAFNWILMEDDGKGNVLSINQESKYFRANRVEVKNSVLLVGNFLSSTNGNHDVCEDLATKLTALGWWVVTTSQKQHRLARLRDMVTTAWRKRDEYDVAQVDVYSGLAFLWAEAICWVLERLGKPYILTMHGGNLPAFAKRWPGRVRRLLRSAEVVTTPSEFLLLHLAPYRSDLRLQLNPIDLHLYRFERRASPQPRLVWLRAFHSVYNPSLAAEVVALLVKDIPEVSLVMYGHDKGDGSLQTMRRLATRLGVSERIETPGGVPKSDVPHRLSAGDIFLNTTNVDNTPISVLEAMACGLCVVSTNVGGMPYLVEHEQDGLLVPPGDAQVMAAAVRRILTEPALAEKLSANARKKAERFDGSAILQQWEKTLTEILSSRRRHLRAIRPSTSGWHS
jgi:glycosyltransferase involved in cell wall biosynthesis